MPAGIRSAARDSASSGWKRYLTGSVAEAAPLLPPADAAAGRAADDDAVAAAAGLRTGAEADDAAPAGRAPVGLAVNPVGGRAQVAALGSPCPRLLLLLLRMQLVASLAQQQPVVRD